MDIKELSPEEYFNKVKDKKHKTDKVELELLAESCLQLINKYVITGQTKALKKLVFHYEIIELERKLVELGFDTYVYREDIAEYIDDVAKKVVKIIELENYQREIPDDIATSIGETRHLFTNYYVVFTDYTGKEEKKIKREAQSKDPILFGTFETENHDEVMDRFYYIGDWEDEFCDLTLTKMVSSFKQEKGIDIECKIPTKITTIEGMKEQIRQLESNSHRKERAIATVATKKAPSLIRIKHWLSKLRGGSNG